MKNRLRPIFILGNPRSGTSLLRLMLHSHPEVSIPPESHFFLWLEKKYGNWNNNMLNDFMIDLFQSRKFETWKLSSSELKCFLLEKKPVNYSQLIANIYIFYSMHFKNNKIITYWGDKNKLWKEKTYLIKKHYPEAIFINLIRDGRDVACSFMALKNLKTTSKYAPKLPYNIEEIAERWKINIDFLHTFFMNLPSNQKKITITYENLLLKPQETLNKINKILNLNFHNETLNFYKMANAEPPDFFTWKEKLKQPLDTNNIGKFKTILSSKEIEQFNKIAFNQLVRYNYI